MLSVLLYEKSLSVLVAEVREGRGKALFDAGPYWHSIMACPTLANRIAKTGLQRDKQFFIRLRNALKGT